MKWYHPSTTLPSKPWLHPDAIAYLESILEPYFRVCEFGGGGSTIWFSLRVQDVTTYEPVDEWRDKIREANRDNIIFLPEWFEILSLPTLFDVLFIDGEPIEDRADWIKYAPNISHTWIVLDNANRPEYAREREALKEYAELVHTVDGNETGTLYLVTEFWRVK
jgi:predicted O-methyltransferase YrrM